MSRFFKLTPVTTMNFETLLLIWKRFCDKVVSKLKVTFPSYVCNMTITNSPSPTQTLLNILRLSLVVEIIYSWWWFWILRLAIFCVLLLHQTRNQFFCSLFIILWIYLFNHDYIFVFHRHCFILFQLYIHQQNLRTNQNRLNRLERPLVQIPKHPFFRGIRCAIFSTLQLINTPLLMHLVFEYYISIKL